MASESILLYQKYMLCANNLKAADFTMGQQGKKYLPR
jgi:hypothetical protein